MTLISNNRKTGQECQLNEQISFYSYNITALYMFLAILCSSSGGHIVYMKHMVSSLSTSGRGFRAAPHDRSWRVTIQYAACIQCDLLRMSIVLQHVEDCNIIWIKRNLCIKLVTDTKPLLWRTVRKTLRSRMRKN
jgi:hypothetical protein